MKLVFIQVASQFENKLGEFDVAHLHHLDTPCLRQAIASGKNDGVEPRVIVKSTDADIVLVDALHAASTTWELPKETRILSTLPSKLSDTNKRCTIVVNPWGVAAWVNEVVGAGLSKDPIGDFTKIYVMSGTDFVDGVPGCGNFTFMDKYLKWLVSTKYTSNQPAQADDTESCSPSLFLAKVIKDTIEHTENKGIKNASLVMSKRRQMCLDADYTQRSLRSLWVLDYWRWSYPDQGRVPSHLGMGWATKAGEHVYTEDILKGVPSNSTQKRIKLC